MRADAVPCRQFGPLIYDKHGHVRLQACWCSGDKMAGLHTVYIQAPLWSAEVVILVLRHFEAGLRSSGRTWPGACSEHRGITETDVGAQAICPT